MFGPRLRVTPELMERLKQCADAAGYSSAEEFAVHALEKAVAEVLDVAGDESAVEDRLRGLGYIE